MEMAKNIRNISISCTGLIYAKIESRRLAINEFLIEILTICNNTTATDHRRHRISTEIYSQFLF